MKLEEYDFNELLNDAEKSIECCSNTILLRKKFKSTKKFMDFTKALKKRFNIDGSSISGPSNSIFSFEYYALWYIENVITERWIDLEDYLIKNPNQNVMEYYIEKVIRGRWLEVEPYFLKSQSRICYYSYAIKKRWKKAESILLENPTFWLIYYIKAHFNGRWLVAEPSILTKPECAYLYTIQIYNRHNGYYNKKKRWDKAEKCILKGENSSKYIYQYAKNIIQGRWPEAEEYFDKNTIWWKYYQKRFIK
jgi:hypothetical protein